MIEFDSPLVLALAPLVGLVVMALGWWGRRTRVQRAARWSRELGDEARRVGRWGGMVIGLAAFFVFVALAGPRFGRRVVTTESKALNLVIGVDISRSMLAEDVAPSRLEKAQREAGRLIQDLGGDRIGLIAFSGGSFILAPLTIDAGALRLLIDGLHPDMASRGGTDLAPALRQARSLLLAGEGVADRVAVVFTDGEVLDSVPPVLEAAAALRRDRIHLILVAEGGSSPANIPVRDPDGVLIGFQRDPDDNVIETWRRDDVLSEVADAAGGVLVSAELGDQAGAVRDLVNGFKRSPQATTTAAQDISRAWIPALVATLLLLGHAATRRTAALAALAILLAGPRPAAAQAYINPADEAWKTGEFDRAAVLYLRQVEAGQGGDTTLFNLGTAAMAIEDTATARAALMRAAESIDPELRFRALYNLGLLNLRLAERDSANAKGYLDEAQRSYREALLLRPRHAEAKWNYELTIRRQPPPQGGGQQSPRPQSGGSSSQEPDDSPQQGLTREQAEQILNSMMEEERRTRDAVNQRRSRARSRSRRKDW